MFLFFYAYDILFMYLCTRLSVFTCGCVVYFFFGYSPVDVLVVLTVNKSVCEILCLFLYLCEWVASTVDGFVLLFLSSPFLVCV
jgi:hypothetical protein